MQSDVQHALFLPNKTINVLGSPAWLQYPRAHGNERTLTTGNSVRCDHFPLQSYIATTERVLAC